MYEKIILPAVLAGGKSNRFGKDKSNAKLGDKTLLEHTISKLANEFSEILIITNNSDLKIINKKVYITKDCIEGQLGPLVGILSAMKWIIKNNKNYKYVASFPCDTPFFDLKVIKEFKRCSNLKSESIHLINSNNQRHNIFGLWPVNTWKILENDIKSYKFRKVEKWADKMNVKIINLNSDKFDKFLNINTKDEFELAKKHFYELNND
mgnify:CR=1 FL=1